MKFLRITTLAALLANIAVIVLPKLLYLLGDSGPPSRMTSIFHWGLYALLAVPGILFFIAFSLFLRTIGRPAFVLSWLAIGAATARIAGRLLAFPIHLPAVAGSLEAVRNHNIMDLFFYGRTFFALFPILFFLVFLFHRKRSGIPTSTGSLMRSTGASALGVVIASSISVSLSLFLHSRAWTPGLIAAFRVVSLGVSLSHIWFYWAMLSQIGGAHGKRPWGNTGAEATKIA